MKFSKLLVYCGFAFATLSSAPATADLADCQNVYVGRIWVEQGYGLKAVVLLNAPTDGGGGLWMYFDNWSADEKKSALAILTSAKLAGHRVNATTTETGGCGVLTSGTQAKMVYLSTN